MKTIVAIFLFSCNMLLGQSDSKLTMEITYQGAALKLNKYYPTINKADSIQITTLKFYLSGISYHSLDNMSVVNDPVFYLIDLENASSLTLPIPEGVVIAKIHMNIGVDSLTNVSGAQDGALDPLNGMYWTWNSGYINFKLEGSGSHITTRKNRFQIHLGGYQAPYNTLRQIELTPQVGCHGPVVSLAIDRFLDSVNFPEAHTIMSPSTKAVLLADKLLDAFKIKS